MPVPPTSISAATITSHAMPIEIRMPVRIVGAAARRMMVNARRKTPTSNVRATLSHSRRTQATPNASGIGESMWAASYSLLRVLSRITAGGLDDLHVEALLAVEAER